MTVMGEIAYLLNCRDLEHSVLSFEGVFGNRPAWIGIIIVVILQLALRMCPGCRLGSVLDMCRGRPGDGSFFSGC
jgi:magnesium-transporting ATPase (P-type)